MHRLPMLVAAALALAITGSAAAQTADKCAPDDLAKTLHERMKKDGKTDAEIGEILGSSFKRKVMVGRVSDGSGCTPEQTEKALEALSTAIKHG